jgi:DNA-binding transcriptional ArsR family regulator
MEQEAWSLGRLLKVSGSFWETCALHAAVRLNIFSLIGDGVLSMEEIALKLGGNKRGVRPHLDALVAMGLLTKTRDGRYGNTEESRTFLCGDSPRYMGHIIKHHAHLMPGWSRLHEAVLSGQPVRDRRRSDEERESFLLGMFNMAMGIAPGLAKEIDLGGRARLLDMGGGPGTYAIHFCLANPDLHGTVFDLPATRPFAEKTIERFGISARVTFQPGDYTKDDIEGTFDTAWLSHILHGEGPAQCRSMIEKAAGVLEPGGLVFIHDFILEDTMDAPLFPALFSLNMLVGTEEGQAYSENQIKEMLAGAGFRDLRRLPFRGPTASGIIRGVK